MVVSAVRPARWAVDQVLTRVRLKKFRIVSRKSALGMLYAVMDRVRSDFERFTAEVEPRVRHVPQSSNYMEHSDIEEE